MIAICCVDNNWGLGKNNGLLFNLPNDLAFFKDTTNNQIVCMGYNTLMSLPGGRPLKNRINVVLCSKKRDCPDCICVHSLEDLLTKVKELEQLTNKTTYIIGGGMVYKLMLPYCSKVYVTHVDTIDNEADTFFPNLLEEDFYITHNGPIIQDGGFDTKVVIYKRRTKNESANY